MIYLQLFLAFLQIGALSFGGGYAAMPLIQAQTVTEHAWITFTDFADLVTIAEMTPGPIAVNAATFVGNRVAGIPGALAATAGVVLPSCLFV
ncbi:MAG: chromate transporter, partial [Clostridia bacterium]|nr:chromate transporter [Clostridia bacterium]